jgi:DNA-binding response OmpR family regulator
MVIVDLNLPGSISGQEVVKRMRASSSMSHLPILIVSGTGEYELRLFRATFPSVHILRKPFKLHALLQSINQCCYVS